MAGISLKGIYKVYPGDVTAVHDFNLEIEDKEFIVLVGPSGCGKSTTLRMIAGLEDITKGELYIGDELVNEVEPKNRNIAMVFQNYALYPHMTAYKNMAFSLQMRKTPKSVIDQKVNEAANVLYIEELLGRKPKELSGGQRQRVALGRAMVRDPAVFLLDEPLSNLDAKLRSSMRTEITKLHKKLGTTFVYVTHDQIEAMTMGDRIVVMKDGFIQQVDTPQKLYEWPCNMFVAGFIGSPQMNFFPAKIQKKDGRYTAVFKDSTFPIPDGRINPDVLAGYEEKEVLVGIRPENMHLDSKNLSSGAFGDMEGTVDVAEMMGAEIYLNLIISDVNFVVRTSSGNPVKSDDHIKLFVDCNRLHLFDADSHVAITEDRNKT